MNETPGTEKQILEALARVPLFSPLDDRSRRKLAKLCTLKTYETGDVIFEEGAIGLSVFVVTSGRVESYKTVDDKRISLGNLEAGDVLGEVSLIDDSPRSASAAALEATACLLLTRDSFETLVKKDPKIAWCLVPSLATRVRELQALTLETELELDKLKKEGGTKVAKRSVKAKESEQEEVHEKHETIADEDEEETSELESAFFKVMRMQYGLLAGGAKSMAEMARMMETFFDSLAEETDIKTSEDWRGILESTPDAMVTATRKAMDEGDRAAQEVVDAYRRYSEGRD